MQYPRCPYNLLTSLHVIAPRSKYFHMLIKKNIAKNIQHDKTHHIRFFKYIKSLIFQIMNFFPEIPPMQRVNSSLH